MKKAFVSDFNGVLYEMKNRVNTVRNPRDADVIVLWQDVRGTNRTLCEINRDYQGIPVVVVQHGRGATRDYLAPNNFKLLADRICVWGEVEWERLRRAGYADRAVITGSPLLTWARRFPKAAHNEKFVIFTPVITSHEEPENLETFYELKKMEYEYAQRWLRENNKVLKEQWDCWAVDKDCPTEREIHYDVIKRGFHLIAKITDIHDQKLYHGPVIKTQQHNKMHLENCFKTARYADCVVGMEEGTFQLLAAYYDCPTIVMEGFKYGSYGGVKNYATELIHTDACAWATLFSLQTEVEKALNDPEAGRAARLKVVREEFDPFGDGSDPVEKIIDVASELADGDIRLANKEELNAVKVDNR